MGKLIRHGRIRTRDLQAQLLRPDPLDYRLPSLYTDILFVQFKAIIRRPGKNPIRKVWKLGVRQKASLNKLICSLQLNPSEDRDHAMLLS